MAGFAKANVEVTVARGRGRWRERARPAGARSPQSRVRVPGAVGRLRGGRSRRAVFDIRGEPCPRCELLGRIKLTCE